MDEPSSNLDMDAIGDLKEHLKLVKKQGKTILIAEHRLYYLMDIADRIVYLEQGNIAGVFSPKELKLIALREREKMGLRAANLNEVHPVTKEVSSYSPFLEIRNMGIYQKKNQFLGKFIYRWVEEKLLRSQVITEQEKRH